MDRSAAAALTKEILALSTADETEILLSQAEENLTRFSNNAISQNVSRHIRELSVKVHVGKKVGRATTDRFDTSSFKKVVETAKIAAEQQKENSDLLPLLPAADYKPSREAFHDQTINFSPEERAAAIRHLVEATQQHQAKAAGIFSTGGESLALANSKGLFAFHRSTTAIFSGTVEIEDGSGWSEDVQRDVSMLDIQKVTETALRKALDSRQPRHLEPGSYTVIFEPAAVSDFLMFMAFESFGGLNFVEGRSFLSGNLGKQVMGKNVTIVDDAYSAINPGLPFDFEGIPRRKVTLIENGIANAVVHDRLTAARCGTFSSGHSLPQPNSAGPLPMNLVLIAGESSLDEMIQSTERGVLITHLHYTNVLDPIKLTLTGMTRDGTFLIEKGRVVGPIKNMRFTENIVEAFNRIELVSQDQLSVNAFFSGSFVVPALKISNFTFSSASEF